MFFSNQTKNLYSHDLSIKVARRRATNRYLDGNILNEPLASLGLNREWLDTQLENIGVSLDNVFLGQVVHRRIVLGSF